MTDASQAHLPYLTITGTTRAVPLPPAAAHAHSPYAAHLNVMLGYINPQSAGGVPIHHRLPRWGISRDWLVLMAPAWLPHVYLVPRSTK